jgi:D-3-phosphoglycerate dehydrogenase
VQIVFVDSTSADTVQKLERLGHNCTILSSEQRLALEDHVTSADVVVVRSTSITRDVIAAAPQLGLIVRAGAGTDTIDLDYASEKGVYVCNVPGQNAVAVAELTLGLILAIDRQIPAAVSDLNRGVWNKDTYSRARGLKGQALGILGMGKIGLEVTVRAASFGLSIHTLARSGRDQVTQQKLEQLDVHLHETLEELLKAVDIVSLHLPLTDETRGMVDAQFLSHLRHGAMLINTSRGGLVNENDLTQAMADRDIRVGLDVYSSEPISGSEDWNTSLSDHANFIGTHHIGASTDQARQAIADGVFEAIGEYQVGVPTNCVNIAGRPLGECAITVRHKDEVGVLAGVLSCLRLAGINVQQMRNEIFEGAGPTAAIATIRLSQAPNPETIEILETLDNVLRVDVLGAS